MSTQTLSDIILAPATGGTLQAYVAKDYPGKKQVYKVNGSLVREVFTFPYHDFILLRTAKGDHLRNLENEPLAEEHWADFYFEPQTNSLYRQDDRGSWYDLEGFRLASPIFLKEDVLISLPGKVSRRSWAFDDQTVVSSPHARIIQVGKLVLNRALEPVLYFGEKVTGLGRKHISFGAEDQWQEVMLGLEHRAFLNEFTGAPLLINDEEIIGHVAGVTRGARHFEVFRSAKREYVLENSSTGNIQYEGRPLGIDLNTYLVLNGSEIVEANDGSQCFYYDLGEGGPYHIPETGKELITKISHDPVRLDGTMLFNVRTAHRTLVYDQELRAPFRMGELQPESVSNVVGFEEYYFMAKIDGRRQLCDKVTRKVIELGSEGVRVNKILSKPGAKLLNAKATNGEDIVLDVRAGLRQPQLARIGEKRVLRSIGPNSRVGDMVLQHIELESLGGSVSRIIDLEEEVLNLFTLPDDLTVYPDQPQPSCFAGNPIINIDLLNPVTILQQDFFSASFLSDMGDVRTVLLQTSNARPLHLDGARHRNELVTGFKERTVRSPFRLGEHRMVGAYTLNEELEEGEFMLSIDKGKSWLPFYDSFLPVFRRAVHIPELATWDCILFEILGPAGTGEYIAVEKNQPFRVLARKSRRKVEPRIITSKTRVLTDPDEMSALTKFFLDPGMLVEVG